jgi:hypothetical protein
MVGYFGIRNQPGAFRGPLMAQGRADAHEMPTPRPTLQARYAAIMLDVPELPAQLERRSVGFGRRWPRRCRWSSCAGGARTAATGASIFVVTSRHRPFSG